MFTIKATATECQTHEVTFVEHWACEIEQMLGADITYTVTSLDEDGQEFTEEYVTQADRIRGHEIEFACEVCDSILETSI